MCANEIIQTDLKGRQRSRLFDIPYENDPSGNDVLVAVSLSAGNPYRFSTKYFDQETNLYYYGYRYYDPELGRWINRDPYDENGGDNLYAFVNNDGINGYDSFGLWGAWRHKNMTYRAYRFATPGFKDLSGEVWINVLHFLQDSNIDVDSGETFKNNAWHFNRKIGEDIEVAKSAYTKLLNKHWDKIIEKTNSPNEKNCTSALEYVGMLSHAWQDYYAHAINKNSDGSKKTIGNVSGNPDAPGDMKPASWGGLWPPRFGEHGVTEPGKRAPDTAMRIKAAENFTAGKFEEFFNIFWEPCKCFIKKRFRQ
ncbi:MAG: RHS repeat-associated core domain-containing protein [Bacteroidetes bacterium]|nr:RHS repeat-associated core domain-containing protein [Bacteroidota bacterium]